MRTVPYSTQLIISFMISNALSEFISSENSPPTRVLTVF